MLAESAGFDALVVSDHLQPWTGNGGVAGFSWASLGALAASTRAATLMTAVGMGQAVNELPLLDAALPPYRDRLARTQEALWLMDTLLSGAEVEVDGGRGRPGGQGDHVRQGHRPHPPDRCGRGPECASAAGRRPTRLVLTCFLVLAGGGDEAWEALRLWRGMRTPRRMEESSPRRPREEADALGRDGVLRRFASREAGPLRALRRPGRRTDRDRCVG
ncbi:hypothetical protein [Streptomyces cylindrosporus]|uniref:LLM class flavin-dependent oxidoreductase n=1 Tax=Streptomyces cylindrosporus TaxID=2927583 RepID=A0ABS9Y8I8_9ACTN|nr:hypothetical protein [Streptomyces cylindrosporus]